MTRTVPFAVLLAGILAGCASNVTMKPPTIPAPLIGKIPVSVGLRMPDDFQHYVHQESVYGKEEWSIDMGRSNAAFFTQLFNFMFKSVVVLDADDDPSKMDIDALIEPSIDAFEFSTPSQSNTDSFAVWIRYRLKVYDHDGTLVSNWPVAAYGKSQTSGGNSQALQHAAVLAMRDAAALMIMKFDKVTRISELADQPVSRPLPTIVPLPEPGGDEEQQDATPENAAPGNAAPGNSTPENTAPENAAPENTAPEAIATEEQQDDSS
jgi:hypothetical protein